MSGKLYRVSTRGYVADIQQILNGYIEQQIKQIQQGDDDPVVVAIAQLHTQGFPLIPLNLKSATTLVHTLIKYQVSTFLAYDTTVLDEQTLAECLFGETIDANELTAPIIEDILAIEAIDNLIVDINLQLSNFLEINTWNIIDILDFDTSLSIVVSEDMRIREWKQMKGLVEQCDSTLDIDLTPVITYLKNSFNRCYGSFTVIHNARPMEIAVGSAMNFRTLVLDYLCTRFGFLRKTGQVGAATHVICDGMNAIAMEKVTTDHAQRDRILRDAIQLTTEAYGICHRLNRLDNTSMYHVDIADDNRLVVTLETEGEGVQGNEEQRLKDLAESFIRGDYLPAKEREEAERYLQQNTF